MVETSNVTEKVHDCIDLPVVGVVLGVIPEIEGYHITVRGVVGSFINLLVDDLNEVN